MTIKTLKHDYAGTDRVITPSVKYFNDKLNKKKTQQFELLFGISFIMPKLQQR